MVERKRQKAVSKKRSTAARAGKAPGKKTHGSASGKAKAPRGSGVTKPAAKKKTTAGRAAGKKPAVGKKAPVAIKSVTKTRKVVKTTRETKADTAAARLQELRKSLISKKETIVREAKEEIAKYISGENRQLVETALDEGDWAVVDISEDINLMRLAAHRKAMHDIDESLRKISEGSYGICEECGEEIGEKRLNVLPTATLCVNCQGDKERLEAIERAEEHPG
jgi:DnaK suppressor protein